MTLIRDLTIGDKFMLHFSQTVYEKREQIKGHGLPTSDLTAVTFPADGHAYGVCKAMLCSQFEAHKVTLKKCPDSDSI